MLIVPISRPKAYDDSDDAENKGILVYTEEDIKGTITEGKLADMVVVDKDPFDIEPDSLKDIKVKKVIVGGILKFQA